MANYWGYPAAQSSDIWAEERLPNFDEVCLTSYSQPTNNKIYVMYHGTDFSAAYSIIKNGFQQSEDGMLGRGVYVTRDKEKALRYPLEDRTEQVVLKLRVNVGKVIAITAQKHQLQKTWHTEEGYDTAWVPPHSGMVKSGLEEDCVWDPKRIKVVGIAHAAHQDHLQYLNKLVKQYAK